MTILVLVRQLVDVADLRLHVEELLDLFHRLLHRHAHLRIAEQADSVEQRDHRLAALTEFGNQSRQVVFEKGFALGHEGLDCGAAIGRIRGCKTKEHPIACRGAVLADAKGHSPVLVLGEGLGVDHFQDDLAIRGGYIGVEHRAYALRKGCQLRRFLRQLRRHEKAKADRLVDLADEFLRAFAEREQLLLGQVDPLEANRFELIRLTAPKMTAASAAPTIASQPLRPGREAGDGC